jgi:hypothetical protein
VGFVSHVAGHEMGRWAQLLRGSWAHLGVHVSYDDSGPVFYELLGRDFPKPTRTTGYQSDLPFKPK